MNQSIIQITGKHVDIGARLKDHAHQALARVVEKYHFEPLEIHVVFAKEPYGIDAQVHITLPHGLKIHGHGTGEHVYAAFDSAAHHIESRVRRHKKRLHDHQKHRDVHPAMIEASSYVLSSSDAEEEDVHADTPLIIAETSTAIPSLTVSEAVMRMDLEAAHVFVFRHKKHGGINVVYRRPDQHIGWIDPGLLPQT